MDSIKRALRAERSYRLKTPFVSPGMAERYWRQALMQALIDRITILSISGRGIGPIHRIFYISFGRQVARVFTRDKGKAKEALKKNRDRWLNLGLDIDILLQIEKRVSLFLKSQNPFQAEDDK